MNEKTKVLVICSAGILATLAAASLLSKADEAAVVSAVVSAEEEIPPLGGLAPLIIEPNDAFEDCLVPLQEADRLRVLAPRRLAFISVFINRPRPGYKPGCV